MPTPATKLLFGNAGMLAGLGIEGWRGAPLLALLITAAIALPVFNLMVLLSSRRAASK